MRKQVSVTREIQAPAEQVWNEIAKVDGWERWLGVLTGSKAEGREVGSTRVCHTEDGDVLETVEMIDHELRLFQYSIQSAPFPVANALGTLRVKELGEDTTEVTWSLNFDPPDEGVDELIAAIEGIYQDGIAGLERIVQALPDTQDNHQQGRHTMHEIMVTREIPTSKERIWKVLDDFGAISTYHPQVERSPITNGVTSGKGARRTCYFQGGGSCDEEITAYRPGTGYTFAVSNFVSFPVARAVADFDISQVAHGTSRVTFRMRFIPKFGPMGWVMAKLMMKAQFRKIMGQILKGLEDQVFAGQVVQPDGSLASNAA